MSSSGERIVTQLIVDSSGAKTGVADFEAAMAKAKAAAESTGQATGNSFDAAQRKWQASIAATDPVFKAQLAMQQAIERQTLTGNRAVELGIATQAQAAAQMEKLTEKHAGLVAAAGQVKEGWLGLISVESLLERSMIRMGEFFAIGEILVFTKEVFESAAALDDLAKRAGVNVETFQAYVAVMKQAGVNSDEADQAVARLTRNIGMALEKGGAARDAFNELGVTFKDLSGGTESAMPKVAQGLLNIQDSSERARIEVALFSRSGQQIEGALRALADPTADLVEKQKALGQVLGEDVTEAAHKAEIQINQTWTSIKNTAAVYVVDFTTSVLDLAKALGDVASHSSVLNLLFTRGGQSLVDEATARARASAHANDGVPQSVIDAQNRGFGWMATDTPGGAANDNAAQSYSSPNLEKYIAQQRISAELAGLSAERRAEELSTITAADHMLTDGSAVLKDSNGVLVKNVTSYQQARDLLGDAKTKQVEALAATIEHGKAWNAVKETLDQYLQGLDQQVHDAGLTADQKKIELDTIKAAVVVQKEHNADAKTYVKTLEEAKAILDPSVVAQIALKDNSAATAQYTLQTKDALAIAQTEFAAGRDDRALAVQQKQEELKLGRDLTATEQDRLQVTQQLKDAANLKDYLVDLHESVKLDGMGADEREREYAVLQEIKATHGNITDSQKDEIRGTIEVRQETQKWRAVADGIAGGFQTFFSDVLDHGKLSFSSLWDTIKSQFNSMLAYMAAQALIQPIILPIVEAFGGGILGGAGAGAGGGGLLSILGMGGNLASGASTLGLFGSGGISGALGLGGIGSSLGGISASLFGTAPEVLAGGEVLGTSGTAGLLGAGGLGSILGGAGIGSLAGSLLFHGADSGIGSMGGAAAGALIGSIVPGVGTIIGGLIGGLAGGGLGSITGSSNNGAIANFTGDGTTNTLFKAGGGNNGQAATAAADTISKTIKTLQDAGVTVSLGNISGLSIGSDKSYVYGFDGMKEKLSGNNVSGVVTSILNKILPSATGTDDVTQGIVDKYKNAGGITAANITQLAQDIQAAQNAKTQADNAATALKNQVNAFGPAISAALKAIVDPIGAQYDTLISSQKTRLDQAQKMGVDVTQLAALNDAELNKFLKGLSAAQLSALSQTADITSTPAFASVTSAAADAAAAQAATLKQAQDAALAQQLAQADNFDQTITATLEGILNPVGAQFDALLKAQRDRLSQAQALGADVSKLAALNTAELNKFFSGLAADQLSALAASRAVASSAGFNVAQSAVNAAAQAAAAQASAAAAAAQAASDLSQNFKSLTTSITDMSKATQASARQAQQTASSWATAFTNLDKASKALMISAPGTSPLDAYNNSRSQFDALRGSAYGGNAIAANDISSFASTFLQSSFAYNASSPAYAADLNYVKGTLNGLTAFTAAQKSLAQQQADSLVAAVAALSTINQTISAGTQKTADGLATLTAQVQQLAANINQANMQARQAA